MKKIFIVLAGCGLFSNFVLADEDFTQERYEQAYQKCLNNDLNSCVQFSIWTRDYMESPSSAVPAAKKACDGKNMKGCNVLGNLYINEYSGLGMDYQKAKALYELSCKGGYRNACRNLEAIKEEMENTEQDEQAKQQRLNRLQESCMVRENTAACEALQLEMR